MSTLKRNCFHGSCSAGAQASEAASTATVDVQAGVIEDEGEAAHVQVSVYSSRASVCTATIDVQAGITEDEGEAAHVQVSVYSSHASECERPPCMPVYPPCMPRQW